MNIVISQPMFFPWIGLFEQIRLADIYVHYSDVQFSKGSFTNRVQVKSASGTKWMTVPLANFRFGQSIDQVQVNNGTDWRNKHKQLLEMCYKAAPYYSDMIGLVDDVYSCDCRYIDEISRNSIEAVSCYFNLIDNTAFHNITSFSVSGSGSSRVLKLVKHLNGDCYITGHGAINYLDHESFEQEKIKVKYMNYEKKIYTQLFGEFTPYVSVLDLIANKGKEGKEWICSTCIDWEEFKQ